MRSHHSVGCGLSHLQQRRGSTAYYLTIEEVKAQGPSECKVRVAATIMGETIEWNAQELMLKFKIADGSGSLAVIYNAPAPTCSGMAPRPQ